MQEHSINYPFAWSRKVLCHGHPKAADCSGASRYKKYEHAAPSLAAEVASAAATVATLIPSIKIWKMLKSMKFSELRYIQIKYRK